MEIKKWLVGLLKKFSLEENILNYICDTNIAKKGLLHDKRNFLD